MRLGNIIRALRREKNLTLKELAKKARLSVSFLSDIEKGRSKPSLETLINISLVLQTTPAALLSEDFLQAMEEEGAFLSENKVARIPVFREIIENENKTTVPYFSKEFAESTEMVVMEKEENQEKLFFLYSPEDSMSGSRILQGDLVLVRKTEVLEEGEIGVFWVPQYGILLRRYFEYEDGIILQADNPHYHPLVLPSHWGYQVIGKVIKVLFEV